MSKLIQVVVIIFLAFQTSYSQVLKSLNNEVSEFNEIKLQWTPTFKEALKKSKKEKKPILMYFTGSDWCGPCKILNTKLFHTEKFKILSDKDLILLEVDIPRRRDLLTASKMKENLFLQQKYGVKAFPTLLMVNHRGKKIAEKKGYIMTEYYYLFFQSVINQY
jgi:thioredoxin-related protein